MLQRTRCHQSIGLSDHRCQIIEVDIPVSRSTKQCVTVCSFRKFPWKDVRESLNTAPWQVMDIFDNVNQIWEFLALFYNIVLINMLHVIMLFLNIPIIQLPSSHQHFPLLSNRKSKADPSLVMILTLPFTKD